MSVQGLEIDNYFRQELASIIGGYTYITHIGHPPRSRPMDSWQERLSKSEALSLHPFRKSLMCTRELRSSVIREVQPYKNRNGNLFKFTRGLRSNVVSPERSKKPHGSSVRCAMGLISKVVRLWQSARKPHGSFVRRAKRAQVQRRQASAG